MTVLKYEIFICTNMNGRGPIYYNLYREYNPHYTVGLRSYYECNNDIPRKQKYLHRIDTRTVQRLRRWSNIV